MVLRAAPLKPSSYNELSVIFTPRAGFFSGILYHNASGQYCCFKSDLDFIMTIESLLDSNQFPMQTNKVRYFNLYSKKNCKPRQKGAINMTKSSEVIINPDKATFVVKIENRQNSTWQGTIRWMEGGDSQNFRSLLEMIKLMESVVGAAAEEK